MKSLKINKTLCNGCRACEISCSAQRTGAFNYKRARIRVKSPYPECAPVFCRQCGKPKCAEACPNGCLVKQDDGVVVFDSANCTKCYACIKACPFEAMFIDPLTGYPLKCDLCGGSPRCIMQCQKKALTWEG